MPVGVSVGVPAATAAPMDSCWVGLLAAMPAVARWATAALGGTVAPEEVRAGLEEATVVVAAGCSPTEAQRRRVRRSRPVSTGTCP